MNVTSPPALLMIAAKSRHCCIDVVQRDPNGSGASAW
jgi:hypothetical protein